MVRRWLPVALIVTITTVSLANVIMSFKDVASGGGTIILARCVPGANNTVVCTAQEVWRGVRPKAAISIPQAAWESETVLGLEKTSDARFLLVVDPDGRVGCMTELPILGDRPTCVLPILKGVLPPEYRWGYDHTDGPSLSLAELKAGLLPQPKSRSSR